MLALVLGSATHSFELMLSAFILGLALGAWWIRSRADRLSDPLRRWKLSPIDLESLDKWDDYTAAKDACSGRQGNDKDVCMKEAKGTEKVAKAEPSDPVEILGLSGVPLAGDTLLVVADERKARQIAALAVDTSANVTTIAIRPSRRAAGAWPGRAHGPDEGSRRARGSARLPSRAARRCPRCCPRG